MVSFVSLGQKSAFLESFLGISIASALNGGDGPKNSRSPGTFTWNAVLGPGFLWVCLLLKGGDSEDKGELNGWEGRKVPENPTEETSRSSQCAAARGWG